MPDPPPDDQSALDLRLKALSRWDNEGGAGPDGPQQTLAVDPSYNSECVYGSYSPTFPKALGFAMDNDEPDEAIHISSDDARGASGSDEGTTSDTLLPMLGIGLVLVIISVIVAVFLFR